MKISFKKQKRETGLAGVGSSNRTDIRLDKSRIGFMSSPSWSSKETKWIIRLAVKRMTEKGGFMWVTLEKRGNDEKHCREIVKEMLPKLHQCTFHKFED